MEKSMLDITPRQIAMFVYTVIAYTLKTIWNITSWLAHGICSIVIFCSGLLAKGTKLASKVLWKVTTTLFKVTYAGMLWCDHQILRGLRAIKGMSKAGWVRTNKILGLITFAIWLTTMNINTLYMYNPYTNMPFYNDYVRETQSQLGMISAKERDVACLALNGYFEARSESLEGQMATAFVVFNRVSSKRHPNRICDVVYQRSKYTCEFSWVCLLDKKQQVPRNAKKWAESLSLARAMITNQQVLHDITGGATFYKATWLKKYSKWWNTLEHVTVIGQHEFFRHPKDVTTPRHETDVLKEQKERLATL